MPIRGCGVVSASLRRTFPWHQRAIALETFEVRGRPCPNGTRSFFLNLHGLIAGTARMPFARAPWLSFEATASPTGTHWQVALAPKLRDPLGRLLRAVYWDLELVPVPELNFGAAHIGVAELRLAWDTYLPLRSEHKAEPLAGIDSVLAGLRGGEEALVQFLVRPASPAWRSHALLAAERLRRGHASSFLSPQGTARARVLQFERARAKAIERKAAEPGYECVLRVLAGGSEPARARALVEMIVAAFGVFTDANAIARRRIRLDAMARLAVEERRAGWRGRYILTASELAALWHLPVLEAPQLWRPSVVHLPPPVDARARDRILGRSTWPGDDRLIGLSVADSRMHLHLLGPTGSGKTTALLGLALQDINAGRGVAILDPKGDLAEAVLSRIPLGRVGDVAYVSPEEDGWCLGINPLELRSEDDADLVAENTLTIFKRLYERFWGMRTDDILKVAIRTMLARGDATLAHIPVLLTDPQFRTEVTGIVTDPFLASFWQWYDGLSESQRTAAIGPVLNKLRDFLVRPRLRRVLCQVRSTLDVARFMDDGGILIADLSVGRWGESASTLIGSFLLSRIWQTALARAAQPEAERRDFFLYVDEFQQFAGYGNSFADALAQARSLRLSLTLANQDLGQLSRELREAIAANARSKAVFQCGRDDAVHLAREFAPLDAGALSALPRFEMAVRLVSDDSAAPFTLRTIPPSAPSAGRAHLVRAASRERFGRQTEAVDRELLGTLRWLGGDPSDGGEA